MRRGALKELVVLADAACYALKRLRDAARPLGVNFSGIERAMCEVVALDNELAPHALTILRDENEQ